MKRLTKTQNYILSVSEERAKHHRAVVHREVCNSSPALDNMTKEQIEKFDSELVDRLKWVDNE